MKALLIFLVSWSVSFVVSEICPHGTFWWPSHKICNPLLTCEVLPNLEIELLLGSGAVKAVFHAKWNDYDLAYVELLNEALKEDFLHGLRMLQRLQDSGVVVKLVGVCEEKMVYLTEYHELGDARKLPEIFQNSWQNYDNAEFRLRLCATYAGILANMHEHGMVMCDSNDLQKTLSQFLVDERALELKVNDMDSVAVLNESKNSVIRCGPKVLHGEFLAPEQRGEKGFRQGYNEKIDVWKIPAVCSFFLGQDASSLRGVMPRLGTLHRLCKSENPVSRPKAKDVAEEYLRIIWMLQHVDEL